MAVLLEKGVSEMSAYDPYVTKDSKLGKRRVHLATSATEATRDASQLHLIPVLGSS